MHQAEVPTIPINIFYSYAHKDARHQENIAKQLKVLVRKNYIITFNKRDILPGQEWENEIDQKLKTADIILLLVSADFMDSDYCYTEEMTLALQRHRAKEARVIPIILSPCEWQESPLGKLNPLPSQGTPVIYWKPQVKAYNDIAIGVRKVVDDVRRRKSRSRVTLHAEQAIEHTHFLKPLPKRPSISPFKALFLDAVDGLREALPEIRNFMVNSFSLGEVGKRAQGFTLLSLFICTVLDIFALPYLFYQWLKVAFLYFFIAFGLMFLIGIANKNSTVAYFTTVLFTLLWLIPGLSHPLNYLNASLPSFWIFIAFIAFLQLMLFRPHNTRKRHRRIF